MFGSFWRTTFRILRNNPTATLIQSFGLGIGLAVFILAQVIVQYEETYDTFFKNHKQIYSAYVKIKPEAGMAVNSTDGVYTALQPVIKENIPEIQKVARALGSEQLVRVGDIKINEYMVFVDDDFLDIFDVTYKYGGGENPIHDPSSVILSETIAKKYFGDDNPVGEVMLINNRHPLKVTGVFNDLPQNSHFMNSITSDGNFGMVASIGARIQIEDFDPVGNWRSINSSDLTYMIIPSGVDVASIDAQINGLYDSQVSVAFKELIGGIGLRKLVDMNLYIWQASGIPAMAGLRLLGVMILIIASINFTSLAIAQGLGRTHEVGIRKSLGASPGQLFTQFLFESMVISFLALIVAITIIQLISPPLRAVTDRDFTLNFGPMTILSLGFLVMIAGLLAGGYPAFVNSRVNTSMALQKNFGGGKKSSRVRNFLLISQFTVSIVLVIFVIVTYAQNNKMQSGAFADLKDKIINVRRMAHPDISPQFDVLVEEWKAIPGVVSVTSSNQVPFDQSTSLLTVSPVSGEESKKIDLLIIRTGDSFEETYGISLVAGRNLSKDFSEDSYGITDRVYDQSTVNVMISEMAVPALGYESPNDALGMFLYEVGDEARDVAYRIVGVREDVNMLGFFNKARPTAWVMPKAVMSQVSIRFETTDVEGVVANIDEIWNRILPAQPIERNFLEDRFNNVFSVFKGINAGLAIFAFIGIAMASVGLFGMTLFIAGKRTKEIGIRKVMGATVPELVRLLTLQFSKPVIIAILIASPLAYFATGAYLQFFQDRISLSLLFYVEIGLGVLLFSWLIVGYHAIRVARANPIDALRYE